MSEIAPKLLGIRTVSVNGTAERIAAVRSAQVSMNAEWAFSTEEISFRFNVDIELSDAEAGVNINRPDKTDEKIGTVGGAIVIQYQTPPGMTEPISDDWYIDFIRARALHDVMPYIRELISTTAVRIGFTGVVIDSIPGHNFGRAPSA